MDSLSQRIWARYKAAGFELEHQRESELCFKNRFSVHFVYLFDNCQKLHDNWRSVHESLINDYVNTQRHRDLEWNYYSIFLVSECCPNEFSRLQQTIQSDTAYSRKFLFATEEINELPPGLIFENQLSISATWAGNPLEQWEQAIGQPLYKEITTTPKSRLKDRLAKYFQKEVNARG